MPDDITSSGSAAPGDAASPAGAFVAHTPNAAGEWHLLTEHLQAVARLSEQFARKFECGELGYCAGLLHDLGKFSPDFQAYLRACEQARTTGGRAPRRGSAPHKQSGAVVAARLGAHPLAFAILGHHGQIPSGGGARNEVQSLDAQRLERLLATARTELDLPSPDPRYAESVRRLAGTPLEGELLIRMLHSCLVDADALDTERHQEPEAAEARSRAALCLPQLRELFFQIPPPRQHQTDPRLGAARQAVFAACVRAAEESPGVFRLTAPTGAGKTRSSLAFALEHAATHGLERVIYALPYSSIVDQTARTFAGWFGEDAVLEHHSAIDPPEDGDPAGNEHERWRRLACQNWDAPLIVTTTVQLFESLFGNRPGKARKVHRLARSVIVLDEVQTLPAKLLSPIVEALRTLCLRYGATVLLCTATQPALDPTALPDAGLENVREIVPDPNRLFSDLARVTYDLSPLADPDGWSWEQVAAEMRTQTAALAVVNTRNDALQLLAALESGPEAGSGTFHLSTLLCGRHRRDVLQEIHRRLATGEPCRVVSTQVVECGVDLDFPLVFRALGPLDRIVQAAGRCNREGARDPSTSRVVVFQPKERRLPRGSYQVATVAAEALLAQAPDLHDPSVYEDYFRQVFRYDDTDARKVQEARKHFDFPAVAQAMRLIDDDTTGVLVRYEGAEDEIEALRRDLQQCREFVPAKLRRRAQPFVVSVTQRDFRNYQRQGLVRELAPDFWEWLGGYGARGLQGTAIEPSELIV